MNGYNKSLFDTEDGTCYVTGKKCDTARHEIFNKYARQHSKRDGLWIAVSPEVHERLHSRGLKSFADQDLWDILKREAQLKWLLADWDRSVNDFVERYGKNYL